MAQQVSHLTQSVYYSPAFDSAIFDGGIRIYFSQCQEAMALKIYFNLQEREKDLDDGLKAHLSQRGINVYLLIYPTEETFRLSFEGEQDVELLPSVIERRLGQDYVIGVRGPLEEDSDFELVYQKLRKVGERFRAQAPPARELQETL